MKKIISIILCVAMLMCCGITAFAADLPHNEATGQSTVTYHVDSSFCVVIPETIDAFNGFQLSSSFMNITDSEQVNVYINGENRIPMTNESGDNFNLQLNLNSRDRVAEFLKNQTTSDFTVYGQQADGDMPAAGEYTGTVEFIVRLESKEIQ